MRKITKEDYEFLKERQMDKEAKRGCKGSIDCDDCILDEYGEANKMGYASCCPSGDNNHIIKQLIEQYENENQENETMDKTEKTMETTETIEENYYERLQRLYRKDFKVGDMVFVKPKDECFKTETCFPCTVFEKEVLEIGEMDDDGDWLFRDKPAFAHSKHWLLPVVDHKDACRAMLDGKTVLDSVHYYNKSLAESYIRGNFRFRDGNIAIGDNSSVKFIILDDEPATTTLTKQEIADKFGINVKYLKITD